LTPLEPEQLAAVTETVSISPQMQPPRVAEPVTVTVQVNLQHAAILAAATAVASVGGMVTAFLFFAAPALKEMEKSQKSLDKASIELEKLMIQNQRDMPILFDEMEKASKEWDALGAELRTMTTGVGRTLGQPSKITTDTIEKAVTEAEKFSEGLGAEVSSMYTTLNDWQVQLNKAVDLTLKSREDRERRERQQREANTWIRNWKYKRAREAKEKEKEEARLAARAKADKEMKPKGNNIIEGSLAYIDGGVAWFQQILPKQKEVEDKPSTNPVVGLLRSEADEQEIRDRAVADALTRAEAAAAWASKASRRLQKLQEAAKTSENEPNRAQRLALKDALTQAENAMDEASTANGVLIEAIREAEMNDADANTADLLLPEVIAAQSNAAATDLNGTTQDQRPNAVENWDDDSLEIPSAAKNQNRFEADTWWRSSAETAN